MTAELKPKTRFNRRCWRRASRGLCGSCGWQGGAWHSTDAEIVSVPGVDLIGPLPREIQHVTLFAVAIASATPNQSLARDFLTFFRSARSPV
jgi:hypothetical protein